MKPIEHIFFDLDHTIWDFETNSNQTLGELFDEYGLDKVIRNKGKFLATYQVVNAIYWKKYTEGKIDKSMLRFERFQDTLKRLKVPNSERLGQEIADEYVFRGPRKIQLFPHAHDTLAYLKEKYPLHIITNGFKEVQGIKLGESRLDQYFEIILCSEDVGVNKPHRRIFETALDRAGADPANSVMIGDNFEVDILGAQKAGMKTIFFDPKKQQKKMGHTVISSLLELQDFF